MIQYAAAVLLSLDFTDYWMPASRA